jgi:hypothetical protein
MTLTASSEYWSDGLEQVRQTLRNIENLELTLKITPPRLTHTDILIREVQDRDKALDQIQTLVLIFALSIGTSVVVFGSILGGIASIFTDISITNVAATIGMINSGVAALWACITFSLRNV